MASNHAIKLATAVALAWPAALLAQQPIVYPAKGQSAQQQQKDEGECHVWAKNKTGVDPLAAASAPPPAAPPQGGERARGAARGAAGGAVIGAIAGDAGKGAAIGATAGTVAGGARQRQSQAAAQQQQQQASAQQQQALTKYTDAYSVCMQGRGYTVK